jgi:hypothetical protein
MLNETLVYIGSSIIIAWGIAHLVPTGQIIKGFGNISEDSKKILAMELLAEGFTLIFLGVLPLVFTILSGPQGKPADIVYLATASMLLLMAILTIFTGARTPDIPYKICPLIKTAVAVLFILGSAY